MKSIAVIIHARMESTRCPQKHLRDLGDGNTLLDIALKKVQKLKNVQEKYLAAHEQEIKDRVVDGIEILHREYKSVAPGNCAHNIMYNHLNKVKADYIINYNPCQPFLNVDKLQEVIDWFNKTPLESAITVKHTKNFFWNKAATPINFKPNDRLSTTSGPGLWEATHSLVMYEKAYMLEHWELFPNTYGNPHPYLIEWPEDELVDVDTELDFKIVKAMYNGS